VALVNLWRKGSFLTLSCVSTQHAPWVTRSIFGINDDNERNWLDSFTCRKVKSSDVQNQKEQSCFLIIGILINRLQKVC
jgi:hypothetical protein